MKKCPGKVRVGTGEARMPNNPCDWKAKRSLDLEALERRAILREGFSIAICIEGVQVTIFRARNQRGDKRYRPAAI
jgi:hypothetical protein